MIFTVFVGEEYDQLLRSEAFRIGIDADALFKVWVYQMLESRKHALRTRSKVVGKKAPGRPRTKKFDQDVLFIRERYERLKEICSDQEYREHHAKQEEVFEKAVQLGDERVIATFLREQPWKIK